MKTTIAKLINSDKALNNLLEQKLPLGISIQLGKVVWSLNRYSRRRMRPGWRSSKVWEEILKDGQPSGSIRSSPRTSKLLKRR